MLIRSHLKSFKEGAIAIPGVEVGGTAIAMLTQHLYPIALGLPAVSLKTVSDKSMVAEAVSGA
jgi:hypothetical protein